MPGFSNKVRKFINDTWHDLWCHYAGFPEPDDHSFDSLDPRSGTYVRYRFIMGKAACPAFCVNPVPEFPVPQAGDDAGRGSSVVEQRQQAEASPRLQEAGDPGSLEVAQDAQVPHVAGSSPAPDQPIRYRPGRPFSGGIRAGMITVRIPIAELLDVKASWMVPGVIVDKLIDAGVPVEHTLLTAKLLYGNLIEKILPEEMVYVWVDDYDPM